jgi:hypothetical protein
MGLPRDPCPKLPPGPGARVDLERSGRLPLGEAKLPALGYQPTGECPLIDRLRVIAKECGKGRDEPNFGLALARLPIVNRPGVHPEPHCRFLLSNGENEPTAPQMLPQSLRLKVPSFWNQ